MLNFYFLVSIRISHCNLLKMYYIYFLILLIIGLCLVSVSSFTKSLKNSRFLLNKCLIKPSLIYATNINRLEISTESSTQLDTFRSASTAKNPLEFIDALQKVSTTSGPGLQEVEAAIVMELLTPILSYIDNHSFMHEQMHLPKSTIHVPASNESSSSWR